MLERWNYLLPAKILDIESLPAGPNAGLQKQQKGHVDAQQDDICEAERRRIKRLGLLGKS
jgi:hypothetical protein